jgi:acyl-CoA thioester hydrolase
MVRSHFATLHPLRVRFSEVDAQGLAHNSVYLVYFGVALHEYYRGLDFDRWAIQARDRVGIHVVQATVNYRAPVRFDDQIEVGVRLTRLGRTSAVFTYAIFPLGAEAILAIGEQTWVNTSQDTHRSAPWSPEFRAAISGREGAAVLA